MNWNRILRPLHPCDVKACPAVTGKPVKANEPTPPCDTCKLKERAW